MSKCLRIVLHMALLGTLAACTMGLYDNWEPIVDVANDPNADQLNGDMAQCKKLALRAGEQEVTVDTGDLTRIFIGPGDFYTDDFDGVETKAYRHAFVACLKERQHPVLTLMPAP